VDTLNEAIRRTVEEAVTRGSVIGISAEVPRLAALCGGEAPNVTEIAAALTREALRSGVGVANPQQVALGRWTCPARFGNERLGAVGALSR
jgi:hypothetical protein